MTTTPHPDPDWSRRYRARAGVDFVEAVWLDGYEDHSIWGYDSGTASFFAQIWRNGSDADEPPELWLSPPDYQMSWAEMVVPLLVDFTGTDPLPVVRGMGLTAPAPCVADLGTVESRLQKWTQLPDSEHARGQIAALEWILGRSSASPSSAAIATQDGPPAPALVSAEVAHATGMVYLTRRDFVGGVEDALVNALVVPGSSSEVR